MPTPIPNPDGRRGARPEQYPIEYLVPSPWQPRLRIDEAKLATLADSIRRDGFMGHVEARPDPADPSKRLQIVFGHRRVLAARLAGLAYVPVAVVNRSDDEMRTIAIIENDTVEALTPWEEALCLERLIRETGWSLTETARQLDRSKGWVQNRHDLTRLPTTSPLRVAVESGQITMTDATTLATMSAAEQAALLPEVIAGTVNVLHLRQMKAEQRATSDAADGPKRPSTERLTELSIEASSSASAQTTDVAGHERSVQTSNGANVEEADANGTMAEDRTRPREDTSRVSSPPPTSQDARVRAVRFADDFDDMVGDVVERRGGVDLSLLLTHVRQRLDARLDELIRCLRA
jgi:ParB family chromosome partitioning protein